MAASYPGSVKTFASRSAGQTIDASHVQDLQDEVNAIEGGLLNGTAPLNSSNSTVASLTVSSNATVTGSLTVSSQVTITAQPRVHVLQSNVQSLSSAATTALTFVAEEFDNGGFHSTATNPSRLTVPTGASGTYTVWAQAFVNTLSTVVTLGLRKNGTSIELRAQRVTGAVAGETVSLWTEIVLNAADYMEVVAVTGASTLSVWASGFDTRFGMSKRA